VSNQDHIYRVQVAVMHLCNCGATWRESVHVREVFRGKTLLAGEIEVFDLTGHLKAKRAYGWLQTEGEANQGERFVAVLEIPPVDSPQTAVKMAIFSAIMNGKLEFSHP
jgi:hypothetical protein